MFVTFEPGNTPKGSFSLRHFDTFTAMLSQDFCGTDNFQMYVDMWSIRTLRLLF